MNYIHYVYILRVISAGVLKGVMRLLWPKPTEVLAATLKLYGVQHVGTEMLTLLLDGVFVVMYMESSVDMTVTR